jgi:hypothetical protein
MSEPSWNDLKPAPQTPREASEFDILCANVLASGSGRQLLDELRRRHVDRPFNLAASERALLVMATEQHFVRELELACERGLKAKPEAT